MENEPNIPGQKPMIPPISSTHPMLSLAESQELANRAEILRQQSAVNGVYAHALNVATQAALEAGALLSKELHQPGGPRGSGSHAPIDNEVEAIIRDRLEAAFPTYGIIGEELGARNRVSQDAAAHIWLVDPNDGTKWFLKGYRGSAVSIGLLRNGQPVLGVVYAFAAPDDHGDLICWAEGCGPVTRNGIPQQRVWPDKLDEHAVIAMSTASDQAPASNGRVLKPARFRAWPSIAYRMALVVVGDADLMVSIYSPGNWDYGAGHALIRGAGGVFINQDGEPVSYSPTGKSKVERCYAGAPELAKTICKRDWSAIGSRETPAVHRLGQTFAEPTKLIADADVLARAQGCWLGQCAGDSLGSLVEFKSPSDIAAAYPHGVRDLADGGTWNTLAGQPTDDTEMALSMARAIIKANGVDFGEIVQAYIAWSQSHPFDMGSTTHTAINTWHTHWRTTPMPPTGPIPATVAKALLCNIHSQANGALMRVSPLGIYSIYLPEETIVKLARLEAALTHPHPVCQDANALFAATIAYAVRTGATREVLYDYAVDLGVRIKVDIAVLQTIKNAKNENCSDFVSQQGWVLIALQNAFYQLCHAENLEAGVIDTVMRGGDTDTNAAIAGALLGASFGRDAVPLRWRNAVLSCRPLAGDPHVCHPRPTDYWPNDGMYLVERLLWIAKA